MDRSRCREPSGTRLGPPRLGGPSQAGATVLMSMLLPPPAPQPTDPARGPAAPPHRPDPFAALLSYLVPGLGQIYQGRVGKGVLFLVCLYALFFYGMFLGRWSN